MPFGEDRRCCFPLGEQEDLRPRWWWASFVERLPLFTDRSTGSIWIGGHSACFYIFLKREKGLVLNSIIISKVRPKLWRRRNIKFLKIFFSSVGTVVTEKMRLRDGVYNAHGGPPTLPPWDLNWSNISITVHKIDESRKKRGAGDAGSYNHKWCHKPWRWKKKRKKIQ